MISAIPCHLAVLISGPGNSGEWGYTGRVQACAYTCRCQILGGLENQGNPKNIVTKKTNFLFFIVLHRYWVDFNTFGCFETPLERTFRYFYYYSYLAR